MIKQLLIKLKRKREYTNRLDNIGYLFGVYRKRYFFIFKENNEEYRERIYARSVSPNTSQCKREEL